MYRVYGDTCRTRSTIKRLSIIILVARELTFRLPSLLLLEIGAHDVWHKANMPLERGPYSKITYISITE